MRIRGFTASGEGLTHRRVFDPIGFEFTGLDEFVLQQLFVNRVSIHSQTVGRAGLNVVALGKGVFEQRFLDVGDHPVEHLPGFVAGQCPLDEQVNDPV